MPKERDPTITFKGFVDEIESGSTPGEHREFDAARARFGIGARVLQQRLAAGLTQQQLAVASGIAQGDISRIERGQANPTAETLGALAGPLGVALDLVPTAVERVSAGGDGGGIARAGAVPAKPLPSM